MLIKEKEIMSNKDEFAHKENKKKEIVPKKKKHRNFREWWFSNCGVIVYYVGMIIFFGSIFGIIIKCSHEEIKREELKEIKQTTGDPTFIGIVDGQYIYKREIDGHEYYMYKHKDNYNHLVDPRFMHSPNCWCNNCEEIKN